MKNNYTKTNWIDNKTPIDASRLNKIENALFELYSSRHNLIPGKGIKIDTTEDNDKVISTTSTELLVVTEIPEEPKSDCLYFIIEENRLGKILFNGNIIWNREN